MKMSDFELKNRNKHKSGTIVEVRGPFGREAEEAGLLNESHSTPIGGLLKIIGSLPEIRQEKVCDLRERITHEQYELGDNLDHALDMVIEELIGEK